MSFHVPERHRVTKGPFGTTIDEGNNGAFRVGKFVCIASDGMGFEHVSVSLYGGKRCPTWDEMCHINDVFWDDDDCVVQYHPPKDDYVNCHPYTLHLWRPTDTEIPHPPSIMVGPK